ncbi:MAG TPA: CPBP family intramembrane glutamic endopeptidase [Actinophytocola sp.]|uniref:CPBP family intramembrane glutamic endopeptidase n=1 Tax=Actinophytocola sp. TaxID=1872138 RepID=UPI002DDDA8E6|nr:CPBP family intramembrane glutamic endopeptidase [Actinophytocola sp.]HEV2777964.1 CPBP family intramembrane glutamic endopeptidase [Actinophytocola sp.]
MLGVFVAAEFALVAASVLVLVPFAVGDPSLLDDGRLPAWPLIALLVVPAVVAALVAVGGTVLVGGGPRAGRVRRELAARWSGRDVGIGVAIGTGGLLVLTVPAALLWAAWVGDDRANSAVGSAFGDRQLDPVAAVTVFLVVWLVAPLGEEVIFRGVLWRALEHWRWNRWVIFAVTSVVFSLAHLELLRTPLLLVLSIPVGLARLLTGNLLASVAAHQVNNFLPAVALLLATTGAVPA